eukprot:tig00000145_g8838.t1
MRIENVAFGPSTPASLLSAPTPTPSRPAPAGAAAPAAGPAALARGRALRIFVSSTFKDMMAERDEIRAVVHPRLRALCDARGLFLHIGDLRWGIRDEEVNSGEVAPPPPPLFRSPSFPFFSFFEITYTVFPVLPSAIHLDRDHGCHPGGPFSPPFLFVLSPVNFIHSLISHFPHFIFLVRPLVPAPAGPTLPPVISILVVMRLCLREVERSTYFVGLIKGRYGWHVKPGAAEDDEDNKLFRRNLEVAAGVFPWVLVLEWSDRSVTEIEIRAGALRNVEAARSRSLFYFAEGAAPDAGEGPYAARRIEELKGEISRSGLPVSNYDGPEQLALAMRDALAAMIERDYPLGQQQTWLQKERAAQASFAEARRRTFIIDPQDAAALDAYAAASGHEIFVLHGAVGCGKSSVLANWSAQWGGAHPGDLTIAHFIGGSQSSSFLSSIARRVSEEVKERWPNEEGVESHGSDAEVAGRLKAWLAAGVARWPGRVVLVLDALDQLRGDPAARSLAWLPPAAGPELRIVVSCVPGPALSATRALPRTRERELAVLTTEQRREVVWRVLQEQGRTLSDDRIDKIVHSPACANALYLRTLLEELSAVAVHATLDAVLESCLACGGPRDLICIVLRRLMQRYNAEGEGENPVAAVAGAIVCSRHGMAESELLALLRVGEPGGPTEVQWSLLWYGMLPMLVDRDGVFGFFHRCAVEAAELEFGLEEAGAARQAAHARLGDFFGAREPSQRRAEEGPWALARAGPGHSDALANLLCDADVLRRLDDFELVELWLRSGRLEDAAACYAKRLHLDAASTTDDAYNLCRAAQVLDKMGRSAEGIPFSQRSVAINERADGPEHPNTAGALHGLAWLYQAMGDYAKALPLYKRSLTIAENSKALGPEHPDTAMVLHSLAGLYQVTGKYGKALTLYERALAIFEQAYGPEHLKTVTMCGSLVALYQAMGAFAKALPLSEQSLTIEEKALGVEHPRAAMALHQLAGLYQAMGKYAKALPLNERSLAIFEKALGPEHPRTAAALHSLAKLHQKLGDYTKALPLYERTLTILEKALGPWHPDTAASLNTLAGLYRAMGEYTKALPLCERACKIEEEYACSSDHPRIKEKARGPEHPDMPAMLRELAELYQETGEYTKALPLYKRALKISKKVLGLTHPATAATFHSLAVLYQTMGKYEKALPMHKHSLEISEKVLGPEHPDMSATLRSLAGLYQAMGQYEKALPLYERSLLISEKTLGLKHPNTATALLQLAGLFQSMGQYEKALPLFEVRSRLEH